MYSFNSNVRFSEVDEDLNIKLKSIVDYFQDCATFQSETLGDDITSMKERGYAWILTSWQIVIDSYPKLYDNIKISTWAHGWKSFFGFRNFTIEDEAGNNLVHANSNWIYMDIHNLHPARITQEMADVYPIDPPYPMEPAPRKIRVPDELAFGDPYNVRKSDIDPNNHVNNGRYVALAEEYLPKGFVTKEIRVEYRNAAFYGNTLYPAYALDQDGNLVVSLNKDEDTAYSVIEFLK